jgi:hypothetical protein
MTHLAEEEYRRPARLTHRPAPLSIYRRSRSVDTIRLRRPSTDLASYAYPPIWENTVTETVEHSVPTSAPSRPPVCDVSRAASPGQTRSSSGPWHSSPLTAPSGGALAQMDVLITVSDTRCYHLCDGHEHHLVTGDLILHRIAVPNLAQPDAPPLYDVVYLSVGDKVQRPMLHRSRTWRCGRAHWVIPVVGERGFLKIVFDDR